MANFAFARIASFALTALACNIAAIGVALECLNGDNVGETLRRFYFAKFDEA